MFYFCEFLNSEKTAAAALADHQKHGHVAVVHQNNHVSFDNQCVCCVWVLFTQGCYSAMVDYFETYIYTAGALAIVVLTIEVRTVFSHYRSTQYFIFILMTKQV